MEDDGLKMEISTSSDTEYKICVICDQTCEENHNPPDGAVNGVNLEDILQYIFVKLEVLLHFIRVSCLKFHFCCSYSDILRRMFSVKPL